MLRKIEIHRYVKKVNVVHVVCDNVLGPTHSHKHRMMAGGVVMATGVTIAKALGHVHFEIVAYIADGIGYFVHGLGCVPFIDYLMEQTKEDESGEN